MKEIEILVEINDDMDKITEVFNDFEYIETKEVLDEYYYDSKRDDLKPNKNNQLNKCLRLRTANGKCTITFKDDVFDNDKWLYSNEFETKVDSHDIIKIIFENLGLKKLLEIRNTKKIYQKDKYEIALENVENLGFFMEVEYCTSDDVDVKKIKSEIQQFIDSLGLNVSKELNMGKPEMVIRKNNICVD